jgi:hypothetical protein
MVDLQTGLTKINITIPLFSQDKQIGSMYPESQKLRGSFPFLGGETHV